MKDFSNIFVQYSDDPSRLNGSMYFTVQTSDGFYHSAQPKFPEQSGASQSAASDFVPAIKSHSSVIKAAMAFTGAEVTIFGFVVSGANSANSQAVKPEADLNFNYNVAGSGQPGNPNPLNHRHSR